MKFSNGDHALIQKTGSDIDLTIVKVTGVAVMFPDRTAAYITEREDGATFEIDGNQWRSISLTEHCLSHLVKIEAVTVTEDTVAIVYAGGKKSTAKSDYPVVHHDGVFITANKLQAGMFVRSYHVSYTDGEKTFLELSF